MFENLTKKVLSGLVAISIAMSGLSVAPAFVHAKDKEDHEFEHRFEHRWDKKNFNKTIKVWTHFNNDDGHFRLNISKNLSGGILSTVSPSFSTVSPASFKVFKQSLKQAKTDQKTATKAAEVTLKTSLQTADTPAEKKSAIKTYFNILLSAFHAFAVAKEAAFTAFINSF